MSLRILCSLFLITVLIVSAGCSPAQAPAVASIPSATLSPMPPSSTPILPTSTPLPPTATLTSTPLPTGTPTPVSNAAKFVDGKMVLPDTAFERIYNTLTGINLSGLYQQQIAILQSMLEYALEPKQRAVVYAFLANNYEKLGHPDLAVEHYLKVLDEGFQSTTIFNAICWNYALMNKPAQALPYCNNAVEQESSAQYLDSRGMVYALLGKYPEAVSDFEACMKLDQYPNEEMKAIRQSWIKVLKTGKNPINAAALKIEGFQEASIEITSFDTNNNTISYLREIFKQQGYQVAETSQDGQPGVKGTLIEGNCHSEVILLGKDRLQSGTFTSWGCDDETLSSNILNFYGPLVTSAREFGNAFVWLEADCYYVIKEKPVSDLTPVFGGYRIKAERVTSDGKQAIKLSADPVK